MSKHIFSKIAKIGEEVREAEAIKVDLAAFSAADFLVGMTQDAQRTYQKSVQYAKEMEQFLKQSRVLNSEAEGLLTAIEKELDSFEADGRKLGIDVKSSPIYKNALDQLSLLNTAVKMTDRFKNL